MNTRGQKFLERLAEQVFVGDGAMGTRLYELTGHLDVSYEALSLTHEHVVQQVHQEYREAGAQLIQTNTFSANRLKLDSFEQGDQARAINQRAAELARAAAGDERFVAGSVGPLPAPEARSEADPLDESTVRAVYAEQITALAEAGVDVILLETFTDIQHIRWALAETQSVCDLPIIAQMTLVDGRHTSDGTDGYVALETLRRDGAQVIGTNCGRGVSKVLSAVKYLGQRTDAPLSAFANAGMPEQVDGRLIYLATPDYMADSAAQMVEAGANLIGGCCGTTAQDIAAIAERVAGMKPVKRRATVAAEPVADEAADAPPRAIPDYLAHLPHKTVVLVELDPPKDTDFAKMVRSAHLLKEAGADAITVGDSPLAGLRMSGMMISPTLQREVDIPVICHLACRDRNVIGTQSLLLGADAMGLRSVLALTGDPAKVGDHPDAVSVYELNSFKLVELIDRMNHGQTLAGRSIGKPTSFHVGVAFNPNKRDVMPEVRRLKRKAERGATFALTQAVFDAETMRIACDAAREHVGIPVFAGVFPLLSARHAEFLHNEFPGVTVCDDVRQRMAAAAPDPERMAAEGMAIARELIDVFRATADGLYLIPPLNRAAIAVELLQHIRATEPVGRSG